MRLFIFFCAAVLQACSPNGSAKERAENAVNLPPDETLWRMAYLPLARSDRHVSWVSVNANGPSADDPKDVWEYQYWDKPRPDGTQIIYASVRYHCHQKTITLKSLTHLSKDGKVVVSGSFAPAEQRKAAIQPDLLDAAALDIVCNDANPERGAHPSSQVEEMSRNLLTIVEKRKPTVSPL